MQQGFVMIIRVHATKQAIPSVSESWQDNSVFGEDAVDRPDGDLDIGMLFLDGGKSFGAAEHGHEMDLRHAPLLEHGDGRERSLGRGDDGIEDDGRVGCALARQTVEVLHGGRSRYAVHADVIDGGLGQELQHAVGHAQSGAQDGNDGDALDQLVAGAIQMIVGAFLAGADADGDGTRREAGGRLVPEVVSDLAKHGTELAGGGVGGAQDADFVQENWMLRDVDAGAEGVLLGGGGRVSAVLADCRRILHFLRGLQRCFCHGRVCFWGHRHLRIVSFCLWWSFYCCVVVVPLSIYYRILGCLCLSAM
mmetsp:Transcript_18192/g.50495  ORF Transcript_18192/g.50495 Transcript_18192/m.50495 type:complete len:307 (-) Transcript_18192:213-1133(-)